MPVSIEELIAHLKTLPKEDYEKLNSFFQASSAAKVDPKPQPESDSESDADSEEEDDWEDIYAEIEGVDDLIGEHEHLLQFATRIKSDTMVKTTYYQTYGGGPEGGYFIKRTYFKHGGHNEEIFSVHRNWGKPFTARPVRGVTEFVYEPATGTRYARCWISKS